MAWRLAKTLIVGTDGAGLEIWTLTGSGWRTSKTIGRRDALYGMTVSADGKVLAVSMSTGWIYFYNTRSWEQTGVLFEPCNFFSGLVFAPDGKSIATAGATFSIWSLAADSTLWKPRGERSFEDITASSRAALRWAHSRPGDNFDDPYGTDIAFSPDGKRLAGTTGVGRLYSGGKRLRAWDTAIGKQVWESRATGMLCTGFTADGKSVLTGSDDGGLCVWTAASGKLVKEWRGHQKAVRQIAPLKDATFVSVGDDGTASVWDTAGNKLMSLKAD